MTDTPKLVGIGGKLRSGKDTVSDYLVEKHGWEKIGMSDALWEALQALDPLIPIDASVEFEVPSRRMSLVYEELLEEGFTPDEAYVKMKENPEVRGLLQALGTEVGRNMIDADVWVKMAADKAIKLLNEGKNVILTGIRFENELTMVGLLGGSLWWVDRPNVYTLESLSGHASENGVKGADFDVVIVNGGTLDQLYDKVEGLISND